jgi:hypothetical protein
MNELLVGLLYLDYSAVAIEFSPVFIAPLFSLCGSYPLWDSPHLHFRLSLSPGFQLHFSIY